MFYKLIALTLTTLLLTASGAVAQNAQSVESQIADMKRQIAALENKEIERARHAETDIKDTGTRMFNWSLNGTAILQAADNKNSGNKKAQLNSSYAVDFIIGKVFEDFGGEIFMEVEAGGGLGMDSDLNLYSGTNFSAMGDDNLKVTELWYKQNFFSDKFSVQTGKIISYYNFDSNEYANNSQTQFLSSMFVNNPAIEFSEDKLGAKLGFYFAPWLEVYYGVFDTSENWSAIEGNLFNIGEVALMPELFGKRGTYRFIAWNNTSGHTKWDDPSKTNKNNYGFALSFDQDIAEGIGLFARYGWQNPKVFNPANQNNNGDVFSVEHSWSAGAQFSAGFLGRENDTFGLAVGQVFASKDYKNAMDVNGDTETHVEAYYNFNLNEKVGLTPSFQYIKNPFGNDIADMRSSLVLGSLRLFYNF